MEANFWLEKWQRNEIGFHEAEAHPLLRKHWATVVKLSNQQSEANKVFVPLCGKSLDMLWLIEQGFHVYGIELSVIAVEAFFSENDIAFDKSHEGDLVKYESEHATIFCGDIFALTSLMLPAIKLFYDRAALIALPPDMRSVYVDKVVSLLGRGSNGLLISLEYDEDLISPPPHSLNVNSIEEISANRFQCQLLGRGTGEVKGKPCTEYAIHLQSID